LNRKHFEPIEAFCSFTAMISSLFKQKKNNRFEYTPRYYDEVKEEIGFRRRQIEQKIQEQGNPTLDQTSFTKGFIRHAAPAKKTLSFSMEWMISLLVSLILYYRFGLSYAIIPLIFPFIIKRIRKLR